MIDGKMLFKLGGPHRFDGDYYSYIVVNKLEVDKHLLDGWHESPALAKAANKNNGTIPPSMLTGEMIEEIRSAKGSHKAISKRFCVSTFTVHKIKKGEL